MKSFRHKFVFVLLAVFSLQMGLLALDARAQSGPGGIGTTDGTSSLVLWLRANAGVTTSGSDVTDWADQSGYGHDAFQATSSRQPTFVASGMNGEPVIQFDGTAKWLTISDADSLDDTEGLTMFVVFDAATNDGNPYGLVSKRVSSASQQAYSLFLYTGGNMYLDIDGNDQRFNNGSSYSTGTDYISTARFDGNASGDESALYTNGGEDATNSESETAIGNYTSDLFIGALNDSYGNYFDGDIAEIIIYRRSLNEVEKFKVEDYLAEKYGITLTTDLYAYDAGYGNSVDGISENATSGESDSLKILANNFDNDEFLFWGHDGDPFELTDPGSSNLPLGNNRVLDRVWRVDLTGSAVTTDLKFVVSDLTLNSGESFRLLVMDSFTDPDYSNADQFDGVVSGDTLTIPEVEITSDVFLSLGRVSASANSQFYSYQTGNWQSADTWTQDESGNTLVPTNGKVPNDASQVTILNGNTVTIPATDSTKQQTKLTIDNGGVLDLTTSTGHNFTDIDGEGRIRIASNNMPSGNFSDFNSSSGGTFEFYGANITLPAAPDTTFNNLVLSNTSASNYTYTQNDNLFVRNNLTLEADGTGSTTFEVGGNTTSRELRVQGDVAINSGATWTVNNPGSSTTHTIYLRGDVTNDGTIDFETANGAADLYFRGSTDNEFASNSTTDLHTLYLDKGTDQTHILTINSTADNFSLTDGGQNLFLENGTLKLESNINLPDIDGTGNFDISYNQDNNARLWVDGATLDFQDALVVYGTFLLSSGTVTVREQGMVNREDGAISIEGGTLNLSKYRVSSTSVTHRGSFSISGGTINIDDAYGNSNNNYAAFSIPFAEQSFTMTGGVINVTYADRGGDAEDGGIQIGADPNNISVTGGTFNVTIEGGDTDFGIASTAPFYNLNISKDPGTGSELALIRDLPFPDGTISGQELVVLNNFTLDNSNSNNPTFDANGFDVTIGNDFNIQSGATYQNTGSANTTTFDQTSTQELNLDGTVSFDNLTIETGNTATINNSPTFTVNNTLTITEGTLSLGSGTMNVSGDVLNSGTITTGSGSVILNSSTASQTLGGDGNGTFGNLEFSNTNGVGGSSQIDFTANQTVTGTLTFNQDRLLDLDTYRLTLDTGGSLSAGSGSFGSSRMIITNGAATAGGIRKNFTSSGGTITYPLGTGSDYTPAYHDLTNTDGAAGSITVRPVSSEHPNVTFQDSSLAYYWKVTKTGFGASPQITHQYTYVTSDIAPNDAASSYVYGRFNSSGLSWSFGNTGDVDEGSQLIGGGGTGLASVSFISGDYTAGYSDAFGTIEIFYSRQNGNWNTNATWSTVAIGGSAASSSPATGDAVVIGDESTDHTISVQAAQSATATTLKLSNASVLDLGTSTGNDIGNVVEGQNDSGFGKLRIASANFPSGDWSDLLQSSDGIVEYYRDGSNFTLPAGVQNYPNLWLSTTSGDAGNLTLPAADISVSGNLQVGRSTNTAALTVYSNTSADRTVEVDGNLSVNGTGGAATIFQLANGSAYDITVDGNISLNSNATWNIENAGADIHTISLGGDLTNNGSLDWTTSSGGLANITFTGAADNSISGSGTTSDFNKVTLDKGTNQTYVLDVNLSSLTIANDSLVLENGTLRLDDAQTITLASSGSFEIPFGAQLYLNGADVQTTSSADVRLDGKLRIANGSSLTVDGDLEYSPTGTPEFQIQGGASSATINGQFRRPSSTTTGDLSYNQSDGSVSVGVSSAGENSRGVFEIANSGSFTMSGGTLTVVRAQSSPSIAALFLQPGSFSISGGTVQIGDDSNTPSSETMLVNATAPLNNLIINSTNSPTARLTIHGLTVNNDVTIESGATLDANSLDMTIKGDMTNSGTFTSGTNTVTFNSTSSDQVITGNTSFNNLAINNQSSGGEVAISNSSNFTINADGNLSVTSGTLELNQSDLNLRGDLTLNDSLLTSNSGLFSMDGSTNQSITTNDAAVIQDFELDNTSGASLNDVLTITGQFTFTNGVLDIAENDLTLTASASISGTTNSSKHIKTRGSSSDAGLTKYFSNGFTGSFTFPLGTGSNDYTPAAYSITSNSGSNNYLTVKPVASTTTASTDDNGDGDDLLSYYWDVNSSGFSGLEVTHTYTYLKDDVQDGSEGDGDNFYEAAYFDGTVWSDGTDDVGTVNTSTLEITVDGGTDASNNGVAYFDGVFTAGETEEFGTLAVYRSVQNGDWDDSNTWDQSGTPDGNPVVIEASDSVATNGDGRRASNLKIYGILNIASDVGHDLGTVTGTGTLIISSSTFPGGDYSGFVAADSGTVRYIGTVTFPPQKTYNNLIIPDPGTKTLPNEDVVVNGDVQILDGTLDASTNNRDLSVRGDWTNNSSFNSGTGTVTFSRNSGSQSIGGTSSTTFYNMHVNAPSATVNLSNDVTIDHDLELLDGTFTTGTNTVTLNGDLVNGAANDALNKARPNDDDRMQPRPVLNTDGTFQFSGTNTQQIRGTVDTTALNDVVVNNSSGQGLELVEHSIRVNGTLQFTDGDIQADTNAVDLGSSGSIDGANGETDAHRIIGKLLVNRTVGPGGSSTFGNVGVSIAGSSDDMGTITVKRVTGSDGVITVDAKDGIARRWVLSNTGAGSFSRDVTFQWLRADDNNRDSTNVAIFKRPVEGSGDMDLIGSFQDVSNTNPRSITVTLSSFSELTASSDENILPVEMTEMLTYPKGTGAVLEWKTETEYENFRFYVERSYLGNTGENFATDTTWNGIGHLDGRGTTTKPHTYTYTDNGLRQSGIYLYRLKQVDYDGKQQYHGPVEFRHQAPEKFDLKQNYPNPFNPTTNIELNIAEKAEVNLVVYDVTGKKVATLYDNEQLEPGTYRKTFDANNLASGVYLIHLRVAGKVFTHKMMLLK